MAFVSILLLSLKKTIIKQLKKHLDASRFRHSLQVEKSAIALAKKYGANPAKAALAGLIHDCARRYDRPGLLRIARQLQLPIDPVCLQEPKLLHAEIGAILARKEFGIKDRAILNAVRRHTAGAPAMSKLDKIIFLADHIAAGRRFTGVKKLRRLAFKNLDQAVILSASLTIANLLKKGLPIYQQTNATRNYYLLKKAK